MPIEIERSDRDFLNELHWTLDSGPLYKTAIWVDPVTECAVTIHIEAAYSDDIDPEEEAEHAGDGSICLAVRLSMYDADGAIVGGLAESAIWVESVGDPALNEVISDCLYESQHEALLNIRP